MGSNYKITYNVDLVFCIDATMSMDNIINIVKNNAINFYQDVKKVMLQKHKVISQMRIKIIAFRDYLADQEKAMLCTRFFNLPEEASAFQNAVMSIEAQGGGDDPEDGLEALVYAIRSDWTKEGMKRRQVIVVWSDAGTHPLGFGSESPSYPSNMAKNFDELTAWWGNKQSGGYMDYHAKRLLLFAPDEEGWSSISNYWENVIHFPSEAGMGLNEVNYQQIIDSIANTI